MAVKKSFVSRADPSKHYDIIVIGAGSGGLNVAGFMNKAGFSVLLIDKSDRSIGGDCLNHGCVPSKALIHAARLAKAAKHSKNFGLSVSGKVDLKKVARYVRSKKEFIREHENANYFQSIGMDVALGAARFVSKNQVAVGKQVFTGKKILLATGSRPRELTIPGVEKVQNLHTNETIFDLEVLPKHLVVVGGGPIGIELGQAFAQLGSKVTILERGQKFLPKEDKEVTEVLREQLAKDGVTVMFETSSKRFSGKNKLVVEQLGKEVTLSFDAILVSIGRQLNIENLDLDKAGIELDASGRKLKVDNYLRTTNKKVLVCGDVAGSYQFTHAAELHAGVIINNFFSPLKKKVSYDHLSWVTYTSPEIATFGLNEAQLTQRAVKFETLRLPFEHDDRAIVDDASYGFLKVYTDGKKLLGGTMVAKDAGELFQELVLANSSRLPLKSIFGKVYPYPTAARVNKSIISKYFARKLTPLAKKVFKLLY